MRAPASTQNKERRVFSKAAAGNQHTFPQQHRAVLSSRKRKNEEETFASSDLLLDSKIQVMLDKLSSCCSKCSNGFGCLLSLFRPPSSTSSSIPTDESFSMEYIDCRNQAVQYIKRCRLYGKVSNPLLSDRENRDNFLQEIFRGCIVDEQRLSTGQIKFSMKYCIPSTSDRLGAINRPQVCKDTLLAVYGFTEHDWRICSEAIKSSDTGRVSSLRHKPWTDDHLPEHTFREAEDVFMNNSGELRAGIYVLKMHYYVAI